MGKKPMIPFRTTLPIIYRNAWLYKLLQVMASFAGRDGHQKLVANPKAMEPILEELCPSACDNYTTFKNLIQALEEDIPFPDFTDDGRVRMTAFMKDTRQVISSLEEARQLYNALMDRYRNSFYNPDERPPPDLYGSDGEPTGNDDRTYKPDLYDSDGEPPDTEAESAPAPGPTDDAVPAAPRIESSRGKVPTLERAIKKIEVLSRTMRAKPKTSHTKAQQAAMRRYNKKFLPVFRLFPTVRENDARQEEGESAKVGGDSRGPEINAMVWDAYTNHEIKKNRVPSYDVLSTLRYLYNQGSHILRDAPADRKEVLAAREAADDRDKYALWEVFMDDRYLRSLAPMIGLHGLDAWRDEFYKNQKWQARKNQKTRVAYDKLDASQFRLPTGQYDGKGAWNAKAKTVRLKVLLEWIYYLQTFIREKISPTTHTIPEKSYRYNWASNYHFKRFRKNFITLTWNNVTEYPRIPPKKGEVIKNADRYRVVLRIWTNLFDRINYRPKYLWMGHTDNIPIVNIDIKPGMAPNRINGGFPDAEQQSAPSNGITNGTSYADKGPQRGVGAAVPSSYAAAVSTSKKGSQTGEAAAAPAAPSNGNTNGHTSTQPRMSQGGAEPSNGITNGTSYADKVSSPNKGQQRGVALAFQRKPRTKFDPSTLNVSAMMTPVWIGTL